MPPPGYILKHEDGDQENNVEREAVLKKLMTIANLNNNSLRYDDPHGSNGLIEAHVSYFKAFDWYIVVAVPVEEIEAPANRLVVSQSYIVAFIIIVSLIITFILVAKILHPLIILTSYANNLPSVDFTSPNVDQIESIRGFSAKYRDEVGRLAESFIYMTNQLKINIVNAIESNAAKERLCLLYTSRYV